MLAMRHQRRKYNERDAVETSERDEYAKYASKYDLHTMLADASIRFES
jgi:hypothetical protein